jgi:peptide/nickel transport system substrate-binding protein
MRFIVFLICWLLLTACAKPVDDTEIKFAIAEIRFAISQAPLNLDPRYATDAASERLNRLIYQPLMDFDAASKPAWILASSHAFDGKQLTITLKDNLPAFHHGKKFSATDVKATYDSLLTLKDSPHAAEFANIASIKVVDDKTVIFNLKTADKHFLEKLVIGILPADLIASNQDFSHNPVGNGALKLVSWDNKIKLQRVKDSAKITLQEVKDPTVRVLKLLRGEVDLLQGDLPPELVKYLQSKPEIVVETGVGSNFSYLGLNFNDPILKQLKVRQAIAHAINRPDIIQKVMVKSTREADQILPPEHYTNQEWFGNKMLSTYDYNPALSKKLLIEAGVKLPLKLVYKTSTDAQRVRFATIMQAQMREAGIDLEIRSLDWGTFFADVKAGNFQLFGLTWVGIKTPEIYSKTFGSQSFPPNGFNRGRYVDAELDKLLLDENWQMATTRIHNELPYIPLWYEGHFVAMQKNMRNYHPKPDGNWDDLAIVTRSAKIMPN